MATLFTGELNTDLARLLFSQGFAQGRQQAFQNMLSAWQAEEMRKARQTEEKNARWSRIIGIMNAAGNVAQGGAMLYSVLGNNNQLPGGVGAGGWFKVPGLQ